MNSEYQTPVEVIEDLLHLGIINQSTSLLEPSAGEGRIIDAARSYGYDYHITAVELDKKFREDLEVNQNIDKLIIGSFLDDEIVNEETIGTFDTILGNPPYDLLESFISKSTELLNKGGQLIFLLRVGSLSGIGRSKFFEKFHPSKIYLLAKRPAFAIKAVDNCGYCWVIWDNPIDYSPTILEWMKYDGPIPRKGKNSKGKIVHSSNS